MQNVPGRLEVPLTHAVFTFQLQTREEPEGQGLVNYGWFAEWQVTLLLLPHWVRAVIWPNWPQTGHKCVILLVGDQDYWCRAPDPTAHFLSFIDL
jgi:hypothetical protein